MDTSTPGGERLTGRIDGAATPAARDAITRMLADLIAIRSVNPMGATHSAPEPVERGIVRYLEAFFADTHARCTRQRVSDAHENLLIALPGETDAPGLLFESHMDTVPAGEWGEAAFVPIIDGRRIVGRGACDDKASLLAMAIALRRLAASEVRPAAPVLLLAAADEEFAQAGIRHFFRTHTGRLRGAVFGEPTLLAPIVQHKGIVRWDITVHGRSAHSSRPELGVNAIAGMRRVLGALEACQRALQETWATPLVGGPTLTVTMIQGGRTRSAVPDACVIAVDLRIVPGMTPLAARAQAIDALAALGLRIEHGEPQLTMPPLDTPGDAPFGQAVLRACRDVAGEAVAFAGVPYGTDAGWCPADVPAIVLGPGDIATAHSDHEEVDVEQIEQAVEIYDRIMTTA